MAFMVRRRKTRRQTQATLASSVTTSGGWYEDPYGTGARRWHDGHGWTDRVEGTAALDKEQAPTTDATRSFDRLTEQPIAIGRAREPRLGVPDARGPASEAVSDDDGLSNSTSATEKDSGGGSSSTLVLGVLHAGSDSEPTQAAGPSVADVPESADETGSQATTASGAPPSVALSQPTQGQPAHPGGADDQPSRLSDPASSPGDGTNAARPVPTRVCAHCAALSHTGGEFCPECGHAFASGRKASGVSRRAKFAMLGVLALLIFGGAGAAIAIKIHHDNQVTAQRHSAAAAALARQQAQQQQQTQNAGETALRQGDETSLQQSITKDAQQQVNNGVLTGPILSTSCTPLSGGSSQNLSSSTGTYDCIAVNKINSDGTSSGYRYSATIDFSSGSASWHLGGN